MTKKIIKIIYLLSILIQISVFSYSQTWNPVGTGVNNSVYSFGLYNDELFAGGWFDTAGTIRTPSIASWDNVKWDSVSSGTYGTPYAFSVYNNELYAGGDFLYAGGLVNTVHIARWNGTNWLSAGSTNNDIGQIKALATYNNNLYAAGNIVKIGGVNINRIAKWNGSNWSNVGGGVTGGFGLIQCMAVYNGQLYVGGDFSSAGGKTTYNIARWNGVAWDSVGCAGFNDVVASMEVDTIRNVLYVGGPFTLVGNASVFQPLKYIARWNDTTWSQVGNPFDHTGAASMEIYHNDLYIAGSSYNGSVNDTIIARWDGTNWYWVQGPNSSVFAIHEYNDTLYVGGAFTLPYENIARYFSPLTILSEEIIKEKEYLGNNVPNPFNSITTISYFVPIGSRGILTINDIDGKLIKTYSLTEGINKFEVSLADYGNGMYFYTLNIDNGKIIRHKKMILNR